MTEQERALEMLVLENERLDLYRLPANFCPRCGKRLAKGFVEISIHTCTPPKDTL